MATTYKVLAQSNPAATTNTDLYTVGAGKSAIVSTIVVANLASTDATFRIAIRVGGATLANQQYVAYNVTVGGADSTTITLGVTLAATDVITVYGSTANIAFNAFGAELS